MQFSVLTGEAALAAMARADFQREWQGLYESCPWATSAQSPSFVLLRCLTYRERARPVLITQRESGALVGLLALALPDDTPWALGAGCEDSEYHVWLAQRDHADTFMPGALDALRDRPDVPPIWLKYVPGDVPLMWATQGRFQLLAELRREETWVLRLDRGDALKFVHSKSRLRSKRNALARLGKVSFRRVEGTAAFDRILDRFDEMSTARRTEKLGMPSKTDPFKRAYLAARQAVPGMQHTTVLELDGNPIAAHIGIEGRRGGAFSLAGITHDPFYDKYSPGSLLLADLIPLLCDEGYRAFDLTPGGDSYKMQWGNRIEPVYQLRLYPSLPSRGIELLRGTAPRVLRKLHSIAQQAVQTNAPLMGHRQGNQ